MDNILNEVGAVYMITDAQLAKVVEMTVRKLNGEQVNGKRYLTASEVTEIYAISPTTLWRWQRSNLVHPSRVGKHRRYDTEEIEKLLKG